MSLCECKIRAYCISRASMHLCSYHTIMNMLGLENFIEVIVEIFNFVSLLTLYTYPWHAVWIPPWNTKKKKKNAENFLCHIIPCQLPPALVFSLAKLSCTINNSHATCQMYCAAYCFNFNLNTLLPMQPLLSSFAILQACNFLRLNALLVSLLYLHFQLSVVLL